MIYGVPARYMNESMNEGARRDGTHIVWRSKVHRHRHRPVAVVVNNGRIMYDDGTHWRHRLL